jgi:hypothetical protein
MAESPSSWWTRVEGLFGRSPDSGLPDKPVLRGGGGRVGNGSDAALLQACTVGSKEGVEQLLLEGASPNHRGEFGATPLTIAAELGSAAIVALLLAAGAEVDTIDDNGDSALLCACRVGQVDAVRMLLNAKADPALTNSQQKNALDAAIEARNYYNRPEVSELLLAHQRDDAEVDTDAGAEGTAFRHLNATRVAEYGFAALLSDMPQRPDDGAWRSCANVRAAPEMTEMTGGVAISERRPSKIRKRIGTLFVRSQTLNVVALI